MISSRKNERVMTTLPTATTKRHLWVVFFADRWKHHGTASKFHQSPFHLLRRAVGNDRHLARREFAMTYLSSPSVIPSAPLEDMPHRMDAPT